MTAATVIAQVAFKELTGETTGGYTICSPGGMTWPEAVAACGAQVTATGQRWEVVPAAGGGWDISYVGPFTGYDPDTWGKQPWPPKPQK